MRQALLVIDVQNDYFTEGKSPLFASESALKQVLQLQAFFRSKRLPIFYIQHIKSDPDADFFVLDSPGAALHPALYPFDQKDTIVVKHFPNSFHQTPLLSILSAANIDQLVICGMMSHMCVDSTTRRAAELGYQPIVVHDACTTKTLKFGQYTVDAQVVHHAFMSSLTAFAMVTSASELFYLG